ncbi:MAG: type II toxin-antitoxin system death-on-curing family toxin [Chloroflexota bacterium]
MSRKNVEDIHAEQIAMYGGAEGLRDPGALEAALAMPQQGSGEQYFHEDIFEMAAAYLFHICANHPYVDGNKRTAAEAADVFLYLNGYDLVMSEEDFEVLVLATAQDQLSKKQIAARLRDQSRPRL